MKSMVFSKFNKLTYDLRKIIKYKLGSEIDRKWHQKKELQ